MPTFLGKVRKKKGFETQAECHDVYCLPFARVLKLPTDILWKPILDQVEGPREVTYLKL